MCAGYRVHRRIFPPTLQLSCSLCLVKVKLPPRNRRQAFALVSLNIEVCKMLRSMIRNPEPFLLK
jgi:hypothetical protein